MGEDRFNLERFVRRQEEDYDRAYKELSEESKRSHWMWWIIPQITGVGMTSTSQEYSIKSLAEAKAYLEHPVLDKFFDGKKDTRTLAILRQIGE